MALSSQPEVPGEAANANDPLLLQVQKLQGILKPMMLRRLKEDVEKNLAPKEETIIEVKRALLTGRAQSFGESSV